jgi:hypothetical protein
MPLPDLNWSCPVRRAHAFLQAGNSSDGNVESVQRLNLPARKRQRDVLRAALVCHDNTLGELAGRFHVSLDFISLFETLTWNCRDRLGERLYLAQICHMPGFAGASGWNREPFDPGRDLLQIACRVGRTQVVLTAAELRLAHAHDLSAEALKTQMVDSILGIVLEGLEVEKVTKADNPLLESVLSIVAARQKEKAEPQKAIQRPSPAEAIKRTFQSALATSQPARSNTTGPT